MSVIRKLADRYEEYIHLPWLEGLAGAQRVIFVIYDKELERVFRAQKQDFKNRTLGAGKQWSEFDCTKIFAEWMAQADYRDDYFEFPEDLRLKVEQEFLDYVTEPLQALLRSSDPNTVVALTGLASLYGFLHISDLVQAVESNIRGRLVVFFPGSKDGSNYRFLDARDGWNYLAQAIMAEGSGGVA